jgi:hypothetical protein
LKGATLNAQKLSRATRRPREWRKIEKVMKNEIYLKVGRVELSREEVEELQETNRVYIVAFRDVYQINHSNAQGCAFATKIYTKYNDLPLTARGRFFAMDAKGVNNLIGFKLLNE